MYEKGHTVIIEQGVGMTPKNLQVVSFDSEWKEIYLGTFRRDNFSAMCPNNVPSASNVKVKYVGKTEDTTVTITSAKWCPLDNCTVLVLGKNIFQFFREHFITFFTLSGSQYGIKLFDWDGSAQIYDYDFNDNGIGVDDRLVAGGMARGNIIFVLLQDSHILMSSQYRNFCRKIEENLHSECKFPALIVQIFLHFDCHFLFEVRANDSFKLRLF